MENNSSYSKLDNENKNDLIKNENQINKEEKNEPKELIIENNYSSVWCMLKLNPFNYTENGENKILNLVAVGFANAKILLIDTSTMQIYQTIKESNTVYSLAQFNKSPKYLISSLSTGFLNIYILKDNIYVEFQTLQKSKRNGINKVICLSNGDIASADKDSITIWRQKKDENNDKIDEIHEFDLFKEIKTFEDTCQLIEVNPNVFACALYKSKLIKIYNNDENEYPVLGKIREIESHGNNSNAMAKINDKIFCVGGKNYSVYVVSIEPVQVIQKFKLVNENSLITVTCLSISNGFLFASYGDNIEQFKVLNDAKNNFIEFKSFDVINNKESQSQAIVTTDDGKIFYQIKGNGTRFNLCSFKIK